MEGANMAFEVSCGAVVYTRVDKEIKYVIVKSLEGDYGFPKGHLIIGETEKQTAYREILEETGLKPKIADGFRTLDEHLIPQKKDVMKKVIYFVAEYSNQEIVCQEDELESVSLMTYDEAMKVLQFERLREILDEARNFIGK